MNNTTVKAVLVERISTKTNKPYVAIELTLAPGYTKLVFPTQAELALMTITSDKVNTPPVQTKP